MELLAFVPLVFMIRSDYKERVVRLYPLLFFGILTIVGSGLTWGWEECVVRVIEGVGMLVFLAGGVVVYLMLKYRKRVNPFRGYIGSGDALFLLCLTPSFRVMELVWFLVIAFVVTLAAWIAWIGRDEGRRGIPLVTTVGVCYACYGVYRLIWHLII